MTTEPNGSRCTLLNEAHALNAHTVLLIHRATVHNFAPVRSPLILRSTQEAGFTIKSKTFFRPDGFLPSTTRCRLSAEKCICSTRTLSLIWNISRPFSATDQTLRICSSDENDATKSLCSAITTSVTCTPKE